MGPHDSVKLHDWYNLVTLGVLNVINLYFHFTGEGYHALWQATAAYFILDIAYIARYPRFVECTKLKSYGASLSISMSCFWYNLCDEKTTHC